MRCLFILLVLTISLNAASQDFQSFLDHVNALGSNDDKQAAVDSFMNAASDFPFIEGNTAHFIYQGNITSAKAVGDFNGWDSNSAYTLTNLNGTDFWYASRDFEANARLDYKFIINGSDWILDPLNPNTISGGFGPNSELAMPEYVQPWEIVDNLSIDKGSVTDASISSTNTNTTFSLKIYLPPNYDAQRDPGYAVAYFQDGFETISLGSGVDVMDNLINAQLIDEIIGVFVRPNDRGAQYGFGDHYDYRDFFVDELVPYIDENYNTVRYANHRAVIGASLGGNISAYIAYTHPEVFGNCGIHSGALFPNNNEVFNLIVDGPKVDVKMANIWGSYESLAGQMTDLTEHFNSTGYDFISSELPEGHSWGLWRATFDDMLEFFFGYLTTSTADDLQSMDLILYHDSSHSKIQYEFNLEVERPFSVKLADMSGKLIHHKKYRGIGRIQGELGVLDLPKGIYSFILEFEDEMLSRKISVVR